MSHLHRMSVLARYGGAGRHRTLIVAAPGLGRGVPVGVERRSMVRIFRHGRLRSVTVVSVAVLGLMATAVAPAGAGRSGGSARAAAFALDVDVDVLGALPLDLGPLARVRLSGDAGPKYANVLKAELPELLEALVLASGAETDLKKKLSSKASSRVATLKLKLLGELLIKLIKSECHVTKNTVEVASDVVFADGSILGIAVDMVGLQARPNSRVSIPAVGSLILNEQIVEKHVGSGKGRVVVTVNALRLELDGILGTGDVTVAQSVCKLRGPGVGKDLKIVSTTNGNDTSDHVKENDRHDDDRGLLGGLLGDSGGLLNVSNILDGGLLGGGGLGGLL